MSLSSRETTTLSSADKPQELRLHCLTAVFCSQLRTDVQGDQTKSCLYQFPFLKALEWQCDRCDHAATQVCLHVKVEPGSIEMTAITRIENHKQRLFSFQNHFLCTWTTLLMLNLYVSHQYVSQTLHLPQTWT